MCRLWRAVKASRQSPATAEAAMTIHRRSGLILAGIAGTLLIVFVFAIPVLINADRYRAKAIFYLEASTGKKVEIGRLALRFFPRLAIHVDDLRKYKQA